MVKCGGCGWHGTIGEANTGQGRWAWAPRTLSLLQGLARCLSVEGECRRIFVGAALVRGRSLVSFGSGWVSNVDMTDS